MMAITRRLVMFGTLASVAALSGCVQNGTFRTYFDSPLEPTATATWRLAEVTVDVPRTLVVSEERSWEPVADIVWREDPPGDRYSQVATIMTAAVRQGAAGLHGGLPVRLEVVVRRFHAMTFEAEALNYDVGVHNVDFTIRAVDARTGAVLAGPDLIEASFPAKTGARMAAARAAGDSQKRMITRHVAATVAAWLGTGPDNRMTFRRVGN